MNGNRIEFYKRRNLNERFSAAAEFIRQNRKVLVKNLVVPALPLVVIVAYFMQSTSPYESLYGMNAQETGKIFLNSMGTLFFTTILSLFLYGMTGSIMWHYQNGTLTDNSGWSDLKDKMFSLAGKTFGIYFVIGIVAVIIAIVFGLFFGLLMFSGGVGTGIFMLLLFLLIFILLLPPLCLVIYPAYFADASVGSSIRKGFSLGIKSWGSCFLMSLIVALAAFFIAVIFMIPSELISVYYGQELNIVTYLLSVLSAFSSVLTVPFIVIFMAFQYFAVIEREEGVSYRNDVDDFDRL